MQYTLYGYHSLTAWTRTANPDICYGYSSCWYDYFNFESFQPLLTEEPDFWFYGPGPPRGMNSGNQLNLGPSTDKLKPPRPTIFKAVSWCWEPLGATVVYWLLNSNGGVEPLKWYIVEYLSPKNASPPVSSGFDTETERTSFVYGNKWDPDALEGDAIHTYDFYQHFKISAGLPGSGKPLFDVSIKWVDGKTYSADHIHISAQSQPQVTNNGVPTGTSCHYPQ